MNVYNGINSIEASANEKLSKIESAKKEQLEMIALRFQTSDRVGYALNRLAIALLASFYGVIFLNDLAKLVKYLRSKKRINGIFKRGEFIAHDDDDDELNFKNRFIANKSYDKRFRLVEASLFKSFFVQNKEASQQEMFGV